MPARPGAGRPSLFSQELANRICAELAKGRGLKAICEADDMPDRGTVTRWMAKDAEFAALCARTREGPQADAVFEDIADIEDKTLTGEIPPDVARVVIGSKQWRAGRLSARYGDKQQLEHVGKDGGPIETRAVDDETRVRALMAFIERTGAKL